MTLGDFRRITDGYGDDCTLSWCKDISSLAFPNLVNRVVINVACPTDAEPNPVPSIIVL